jgi:hypothetical protein
LALSVINTFYQRKKDQQGDWTTKISDAVAPFKGLPDAVSEIRAELQVLKKQVEVFWKGVSFSSAQALHSPHTKELDELLEKFQRDEIQSELELAKLKQMLQEVAETDTNPMRKKYALDILTLIHVRFEIGGDLVTAMRQAN